MARLHCMDCGNPDCPSVDSAAYWARCPAAFGAPKRKPSRRCGTKPTDLAERLSRAAMALKEP